MKGKGGYEPTIEPLSKFSRKKWRLVTIVVSVTNNKTTSNKN
jgi:hypothetical protein